MKRYMLAITILLILNMTIPGILAQDELTETFTAEDGSLSIPYPAGWEITEARANEVFMRSADSTAFVAIAWGTASYLTFDALADANTYPQAVLLSFLQETGATMPTVPQEVEVNGTAFVGGSVQDGIVFYAVSEPEEDRFVILDADLDSQETLNALEPVFMAMVSGASMGAAEEPSLAPAAVEITGPEDCINVAVSIGDYSSEFDADYTPANLLDDNPATGWSSAGGVEEPEYVVINLDGVQVVGGLLFDSYSPSPGYETDSIKGFRLKAGDAVVFEGEAALEPGYQVYTFAPVETDHIKLVVTSTHGGSYFEAADVMICAAEADELPTGQEVRQWAVSATATSQYSDPAWSVAQATGEPDTLECGDLDTAWASASATGVEWLALEYAQAVVPAQINIYQTFNPGAIVKVEAVTEAGEIIELPDSADPPGNTPCPGVFTVEIDEALPPVNAVVIYLDQSITENWNEIDAVELVGAVDAEGEADEQEQPSAAGAADVPALSETFASTAEHLSVNYPEGWIAKDTAGGQASLATGDFVSFVMGLSPGEVQITINESITTDPSAMDHLVADMEQMASGLGFELGEATETTFGGAGAARLEAETDKWHMLAVSIERSDGQYFDVRAYAHPDEFAQYEPLFLAILDSIVYVP